MYIVNVLTSYFLTIFGIIFLEIFLYHVVSYAFRKGVVYSMLIDTEGSCEGDYGNLITGPLMVVYIK